MARPAPAQKREAARRLQATEQARAASLAAQAASAREAAQASSRQAALASQRVFATARLRTLENRVQDAAEQVRGAEHDQRLAAQGVDARLAAIGTLLPLALRLSRYPAETLLAAPVPPGRAVLGLLAVQGVMTDLARQVAALRAEQVQALSMAQTVARRKTALAVEQAHQAKAAAELDAQIQDAGRAHSEAMDEVSQAAEAASALAARARDLRSAIAAMDEAERQDAARQAREQAADAARRHGHAAGVGPPRKAVLGAAAGPGLAASSRATLVAGRIVRMFGAASDDGTATGLTFSVAPGAFVAAPCTGRVAFAAPFRSYGKLMIVECGGGYDFVLSGMARLDKAVGQRVSPGEPVARMPDSGGPLLYVELRKGGAPVDPLPFLNGKA